MKSLTDEFEACAERVSRDGIDGISREKQLKLYAFYSVVTKGVPPDRGPLQLLDPRGSAKWHAWNTERETTVYAIVDSVYGSSLGLESLQAHAYL